MTKLALQKVLEVKNVKKLSKEVSYIPRKIISDYLNQNKESTHKHTPPPSPIARKK